MLSRVNSMVWMDGNKGEEDQQQQPSSWPNGENNNNNKEEMEIGAISTFKSMLEAEGDDWYMPTNPSAANSGGGGAMHGHQDITFSPTFGDNHNHNQLVNLQPVDSTASCSPTSASVFSHLNHHHPAQVNYFMQPKSFISPIPNNPLDGTFDLGCHGGFLESAFTSFGDIGAQSQLGNGVINLNPSSTIQFGSSNSNTASLIQLPQGSSGFGAAFGFADTSAMQGNTNTHTNTNNTNSTSSLLLNRSSKILKPLDNLGSQPTLFQKRAALRKNNAGGSSLGSLNLGGGNVSPFRLKSPTNANNERLFEGIGDRKRKSSSGDDVEDLSIDGSNLNYDSDEQFLENGGKIEEPGAKNGGSSSHANSGVVGGDPKGKKKGLPAKNLMAERRRRKKLNDRLYMLRSVVPKISKMDRASILGDAIEYLKELLQKINDLHNELESIPSSSSLTPTTGLYPLTPTTPGLSNRIKEELCPSAFASPLSSPTGQPARVEVRLREGRAVNIHMFCGRRPGLLLSTMRAMDNLGLDVQQAVISCFNGFALDVFRAEQCREGQELNPEQIKAVLLDSAGYHGMV